MEILFTQQHNYLGNAVQHQVGYT